MLQQQWRELSQHLRHPGNVLCGSLDVSSALPYSLHTSA